ncbi:DUF1007 family protein [Pelagibius sp.]|uniref:DUF1007 family protein n=1 Tax=Pelagibius sp. TaxID=1931238 RepID=UPI002616B30F|nr:DUF1007 family protein [Pelagibius sp.]
MPRVDARLTALLCAAAALGTALLPTAEPAWAHPHVWIESKTKILFDADQRVRGLEVEWRFDEFYSVFAVEGLDANGDGRFDEQELQPLAEVNVTSLRDYRYFVYVSVGGRDAEYGKVVDFGSTFEDGLLSLRFVLPLAQPVDPRIESVDFTSYDPSFYISIDAADDRGVTVAGSAPAECDLRMERGGETESLNIAETDIFDPAGLSIAAQFATQVTLDCPPAVATQ